MCAHGKYGTHKRSLMLQNHGAKFMFYLTTIMPPSPFFFSLHNFMHMVTVMQKLCPGGGHTDK